MNTLQRDHVSFAGPAAAAVAREPLAIVPESQAPSVAHPASAADLAPAGPNSDQIAQIVHDFNNLLTLVLGYGETILMSLPESHPVYSFASQICNAAKEGARLSRDLSVLIRQTPRQS
jgi:hypothetical protein